MVHKYAGVVVASWIEFEFTCFTQLFVREKHMNIHCILSWICIPTFWVFYISGESNPGGIPEQVCFVLFCFVFFMTEGVVKVIWLYVCDVHIVNVVISRRNVVLHFQGRLTVNCFSCFSEPILLILYVRTLHEEQC